MRKSIVILSFTTLFLNAHSFQTEELISLPHPGEFIRNGEIKLPKEKKMKIQKEIKGVYAPLFQEKLAKAYELEKEVQKAVNEGKTKKELAQLLDEIVKLKREAIELRIEALNEFKKIIPKKDWEMINNKTYE